MDVVHLHSTRRLLPVYLLIYLLYILFIDVRINLEITSFMYY